MPCARSGSAPGLIRTRSVNRVHEVRVTARPAVGPLTRGNSWDDNRTAPIMPRVPEGPRSRSGAFHSLPSSVRYGGPRTPRPDTAAVTVRAIGTAPSAALSTALSTALSAARPRDGGLRRGWPGRGHRLAS
jgi:hypothetical protein